MSSGVSARKWHCFPAQAATIILSAQKKTLHSGAEGCHGGFRAGLAAEFRAGGYTVHFERIWRPIPAQAATISHSAQKKIPYSGAEGCHGVFRADLAAESCAGPHLRVICACYAGNSRAGGYIFRSRRIWRLIPARATKKADQKGQLRRLLFKICVITQFTYYS